MFASLHRLALSMAIALLPATAFSWGSQAGDNGRQPIGADNEGPRQAVPSATTNDLPIDYQAGTAYYSATTAHDRALYYCDQKPLRLQGACRDAVEARYGYPSGGYIESHPAYMTYFYPAPAAQYWRYDTYAATPEYYVVSPYPGNTTLANTNSLNRCAALYGAARADCLHGATPGG